MPKPFFHACPEPKRWLRIVLKRQPFLCTSRADSPSWQRDWERAAFRRAAILEHVYAAAHISVLMAGDRTRPSFARIVSERINLYLHNPSATSF